MVKNRDTLDRETTPSFIRRHERVILVLVLFVGLMSLYLIANYLTAGRAQPALATSLDEAIPLDPRFEYIYALVYIFLLLPVYLEPLLELYAQAVQIHRDQIVLADRADRGACAIRC